MTLRPVRTHLGRAVLAVLAAAAVGALALHAEQAQPKKSEAKVTATASKPDADGKQTVTVTAEINPDWYIYANPVGNEMFEELATKITVAGKEKLVSVKVNYPAGKAKSLGDIKYTAYEGKVQIPVVVQRAKGDIGPLEVTVYLNTCNAKSGVCKPPETVKLMVP